MRDPVHGAQRTPVQPPEGTGLRLGHDLLAASAGLERGQHLAAAARGPAGRTQRGRTSGPVPLCGRLFPRQDTQRGQHTGPPPAARDRTGSKHHLITNGSGTPLAVLLTDGNPQRRPPAPAPAPARRDPARPRPGWSSSPKAGLTALRPRPQPQHLPPPGPRPRHRSRDHGTLHGTQPAPEHDLHPPSAGISRAKGTKGSAVLPRHRKIEHTISWHMKPHHNTHDYEHPPQHTETHPN